MAVAIGAGCTFPEAESAPPPAVNPAAAPGGALNVGVAALPGVDPLSYHNPSSSLLGSVLCDTLVTLDPETGEVRPGLAQKWTLTDDGARIIVQLRKDAYFHDGRKVRSADVAESLERLANPDNASYMAELMNGVAGLPRFRADIEEGLPVPPLHGVRVIEPYSFEIFLDAKNPDFLRVLAHPATAPVSKAPYDRDPASAPSYPQCAGPYRLATPYQPGAAEVVLTRFDRYHQDTTAFTAGGRGWADEIRFRVYPDDQAAYRAYERGEVDIVGVPSDRAREAKDRHGDRVVVGDSPYVEFIALPHGTTSVFGDPRTRIALSQALDREAIVHAAYGGAHKPATGFVPPALTTPAVRTTGKTAVKAVEFGCGDRTPVNGDRDAARRAWAEAQDAKEPAQRLPPDATLSLFVNELQHGPLAETVARQWREVLGLDVQPVLLSWEEYRQRMLQEGGAGPGTVRPPGDNGAPSGDDGRPAAAGPPGAGVPGPFRLSYAPAYSSIQAFLGALFLSRAGGSANSARYDSPEFDLVLEEDTRPVVDDHERLLRYRELEDLLCNDMPIIPVAFGRRAFLMRERVVPVRTSGRLLTRDGMPVLRDMAVGP